MDSDSSSSSSSSDNSTHSDHSIILAVYNESSGLHLLGHFLNNICTCVWLAYIVLFFQNVLQFNPIHSALILFIGQVTNAVSTLFIRRQLNGGYVSKKICYLIGTICVGIAYPFLFTKCINCEEAHHWAQLLYFSPFVIISQFGLACVHISHLWRTPHNREITADERVKVTIMRNKCLYTVKCLTCVLFCVIPLTSTSVLTPNFSNDENPFLIITLLVIGIGSLFSIAFYNNFDDWDAGRCELDAELQGYTTNFKFYQVAIVYISCTLSVGLAQIYIPLYLHENLKVPALFVALIPAVILVSGIFVAGIGPELRKSERIGVYCFFALLNAVVYICIYVGHGQLFSDIGIWVVSILLGISAGAMVSIVQEMAHDLVDPSHLFRNASLVSVYGALNVGEKLCIGVSVMVIQYTKSCFDDYPNYNRDVLVFGCGGAALFSLITAFLMKKYDADAETDAELERLLLTINGDSLSTLEE